MKARSMKKKTTVLGALITSVTLCFCMMVFSACSAGPESETMTLYYQTVDDTEQVPVYFDDKNHQIPYLDLTTWQHVASRVVNEGMGDYPEDPGYKLELTSRGNTAVLTRENGSTLTFDFDANTLTFSNFDRFTEQSYDLTPVDVAHTSGFDENGKANYLTRNEDLSFACEGNEVTINLAEYGIKLIHAENKYYVPAQTLFDLLLSSNYVNFLYNTESLFIMDFETACNEVSTSGTDEAGNEITKEAPSGLMKQYYSASVGDMSKELINFSYAETCMILDNYYGLKEEKGIESFDDYFQRTQFNGKSFKEALTSGDAHEMDEALSALSYWCIDDVHTKYVASSVYTGFDTSINKNTWKGVSRTKILDSTDEFCDARSAAYPDGCPHYEEVGDTAYVTFDEFTNPEINYYETGIAGATNESNDVMGILIYATSQIKREGSPIKNVVVDLSCNGGGSEDAVCYTCAWMLGKANVSMTSSISGATCTTNYSCDTNLDGVFDENDTVENLKLYCLISPASFSCANLTPTMLENDGSVTLLGQTTGGGACVVQPMTTATGSFWRFSGYKVMSFYKNGSYYCSDSGVDPDFTLSKPSSFYDRTALTNYIDELM